MEAVSRARRVSGNASPETAPSSRSLVENTAGRQGNKLTSAEANYTQDIVRFAITNMCDSPSSGHDTTTQRRVQLQLLGVFDQTCDIGSAGSLDRCRRSESRLSKVSAANDSTLIRGEHEV